MKNWEQIANDSFSNEFANFKNTLKGKGRRPDAVEFTTIEEDVKRRDLTINALFYDIDTCEIVDLVGGVNDLKNGRIKTVGSPEERFDEDRLRILRAIRFAARFGSELNEDVDIALKKDCSLQGISAERIRDEFLKGVKSAKSVKNFLTLLNEYSLFQWIFGSLSLDEFIEERDTVVLLSFLLKNNSIETVRKILFENKYSAEEIKQIVFLINLKQLKESNVYHTKRLHLTSKLADEQIRIFAQFSNIDEKLIECFLAYQLTISGEILTNQGFVGKYIGIEQVRRETELFRQLFEK